MVYVVHYSHNSGCCRRSVAPWITVLLWHTVFTKKVIYYKFTLAWYSAKQGTMQKPTPHLVHLYTGPFLQPREEHRRQSSLVWFRRPVFVMATSAEACCCCCSSSSSKQSSNIARFCTWFPVGVNNQNFTDGFFLKFYLFFSGHCSRPTIICLV